MNFLKSTNMETPKTRKEKIKMADYEPKAQISKITATSRMSLKVKENFFTVIASS